MFGFISCHTHLTVKMLQHRTMMPFTREKLLYILVAAIKLSLCHPMFL